MDKTTPDRRQSKTILSIDERGSKIAKTVFSMPLSPVGRQMTIENSVSSNIDLRSSIVHVYITYSIVAYPV